MATMAAKMVCPRCGIEMNHHCDKLVYGSGPQDTDTLDSALGGHIEEFHSCLNCGAGASRRADATLKP